MNESTTRPPSMAKFLLWTTLWLFMWFWAIAGALFVVLAAASFFVDISPVVSLTPFGGETIRTPQQKAIVLLLGAVVCLVGVGYLWLRRRRYLNATV